MIDDAGWMLLMMLFVVFFWYFIYLFFSLKKMSGDGESNLP